MKNILSKLHRGQSLFENEARELMLGMTNKSFNETQIVSAITALIMRPLCYTEISTFQNVLLENAKKPNLDGSYAIDLCGTGGDGKNSFNISTLSALVVAAAGYKVIKHGNYGVSSNCGSSTVLEYLGYRFTDEELVLKKQFTNHNICFLHAPLFHPALKNVMEIRRDLGVRSFFNYLGPLLNPVQPKYQLTGVYNLEVLRLYNEVLPAIRKKFTIVHSLNGYDEICLTSSFKMSCNGIVQLYNPSEFGFENYSTEHIVGGSSIAESAEIFMNILEGKGTKAQKAVVLINAAIAIQCMEENGAFDSALNKAQDALNEGRALQLFHQLLKSDYVNS